MYYAGCAMYYAGCAMYYAGCAMYYSGWAMYYAGWAMYYAGCAMYYAGCAMYYAGCAMYYAGCAMYYAGCAMYYAGCAMYYAGCAMYYAGCAMYYAGCAMYYAGCAMYYAGCAMYYAGCAMYYAGCAMYYAGCAMYYAGCAMYYAGCAMYYAGCAMYYAGCAMYYAGCAMYYAGCAMYYAGCAMYYAGCAMYYAGCAMYYAGCAMYYAGCAMYYAGCAMYYAGCAMYYAGCAMYYAGCAMYYAGCAMYYAGCAMYYAGCAMYYAGCAMYYAGCAMYYAGCAMYYAGWAMYYAGCAMYYAGCAMYYAGCAMYYAGCAMYYAGCAMYYAGCAMYYAGCAMYYAGCAVYYAGWAVYYAGWAMYILIKPSWKVGSGPALRAALVLSGIEQSAGEGMYLEMDQGRPVVYVSPEASSSIMGYLPAVDHTLIGSDDSQDIQLCGMGILPAHCIIDISTDGQVILSPMKNARTLVNGSVVTNPTQLQHGDRILWGNNHFLRISLPKKKKSSEREDEERDASMRNSSSFEQLDADGDSSSEVSSEVNFNYEYAQMEVMMKTLGNNDPMQSLLQTMEQQHEEEKRSALERQRLMYEHELEQLRRRLSPEKQHYRSIDRFSFGSPNAQQRIRQWTEDREVMLNHSLSKLREQIAKANMYVREASYIADEMDKRTEYKVTLQIPASSLNANRKRGEVMSEPAIQVRRKGKGKQIWSLEKLENRLVDIRDLYQEWKECEEDSPVTRAYFRRADPFYDEQENHSLIGVANVFLESLFHDVKLQYAVPIINQKGEISGRLHIEVVRVSGDIDERIAGGEDGEMTNDGKTQEHKLVCMVKVLQATGLPQHLTNFVFCHYTFYDQLDPIMVAPEVDPNTSSPISKEPQCMVVFDHCKEFSVGITEDFLEYLAEGALAIEVYGHKTNDPRKNPALWDLGIIQAKTRIIPAKDVQTGGIYQLRQGQSRRLQVEVRSVQDSGTLPLIEDSILSVSVGCVKIVHAKTGKGQDVHHQDGGEDIDSYQDRDLDRLKRKWLNALTKRQEYLDQQLQKLVSRQDKTEDDSEREAQLLEMRLTLTEERNSVLVPSAGSGIPGAPANWTPVSGMETHIPVIFLDLNADDFSSQDNLDEPEAAGWDATLTAEEEDEFFDLQIVKHHEAEVKAEASWDCTVHNSPHLSKGSSADERVFLIVRVTVQLSHPAEMQLVLRKRICVNVYSRQGFAQNFLRRMSSRSNITSCGVTVEIVSNIPEDSQGAEDREALARMAADVDCDNSTYIEKYLRSVLAVENILTLDRLRQAFCPIGRGYRDPCRPSGEQCQSSGDQTPCDHKQGPDVKLPSYLAPPKCEWRRRASAPPRLLQETWDGFKMPRGGMSVVPQSSSPRHGAKEYDAYWREKLDLLLGNS
ncbi:unnamed protein product [Ranitomeya imitator]|uniref:Kinesin n=1 Tax=Ranitomeya imitator TaxID=111125 RepID=A0ABN9KN36_9NEOB|nr:unnamed protein product [Ranitomeya imitator]